MNQKQIAKALGVSQTSVSLVLNNPRTEKVSESKRKAILDYIRNNNYTVKNEGPTGNIAYLINNRMDMNNPFYQRFFSGIEKAATAAGYNVIIESNDIEKSLLFSKKKVDGFIIERNLNKEQIKKVSSISAPIVSLNSPVESLYSDAVFADNYGGMKVAVSYLVQLGLSKIGFFSITPKNNVPLNYKERVNGFYNSCRDSGVTIRDDYIKIIQPSENSLIQDDDLPNTEHIIRETLSEWLKEDNLPDAVICINDLYATIMLREAAAMGISVPNDFSIIGTDNSPASEHSFPALSSVDHNAEEMGHLSVDFLIKRIEGYTGKFMKVSCEAKLIIRKSTRST